MLFSFSLKSSVLLIFFLHGIVFSGLLLIKGFQSERKSNHWLSFFTFLCALYIAPFMLGYAGWYSRNPYRDILFYIPFQQLLLMPPVLYFYCKALFDQSFVFKRSDLLHFFPAFIYLLYSLILFVGDKIILNSAYFYTDGKDKDFSFWYQVLGLTSMILYLVKSLQLYKRYESIIFETVSFADTLTFKWARRFLIAFIMLIMLRVAFFIINPEWAQFGRKFWYYLSFSVLFYYISISGFANSIRSVVSFEGFPNPIPFKSISNLGYSVENDISGKESQNPKEIEMTIPDLELWKERVERLMREDKIFENPELSIYDLSQQLDTHPKKVSQIINLGFEMNFNDYVNKKRVHAIIEKLEAGMHSIHTLLGIAFECGFNSKSTFNRAFKRHTLLSPQEYIKKNVR